MARLQPPHVNGVMEFDEQEFMQIAEKLLAIRDSFVDTDEQPVCDTFYLVSTYNRENPDAPINGDTCEYVLGNVEIIEPPVEEEVDA